MTEAAISTLSDAARVEALAHLPGWELVSAGRGIQKHFVFADFTEAFAFMTRVALAAERVEHHPQWSNIYDRVTIELTTHDAGGVSPRDIDLAHRIDGIRGEQS